ncbi:MAG TPA: NrfD/PsrC family molybdoenzyme membrane anchor subunit, partial [Ktedonobacterales bacterium]|nr:NrfD/PsrC family molybdoenzyme membrane anchor subunit [Ktedonobacterales bacterium]
MSITSPGAMPAGAPVVASDVTLTSLSEGVSSRVLMRRAPLWWWVGFTIASLLLTVLVIQMAWLFVNGIGVWGVNIPVAWGFALAEYVWWIALASGGTIVSALFFLTRSPWRSATNRIAESMLLSAAPCAGVMPIMHLGRPGLFYWLFPYSNV